MSHEADERADAWCDSVDAMEEFNAEHNGDNQRLDKALSNPDLQKLVHDILAFAGDVTDKDEEVDGFWEKARRIQLDGCEFGARVQIEWNVEGERFSDTGYLTTVPHVYSEDTPEFSGVIHVPNPQNPGGKDQPAGEWISVYDAIKNPLIVHIKPLPWRD